jgi:hypothetical protein
VTFDHRTTHLHVADLDRQIEQLRTERRVGAARASTGALGLARQGAGRILIAAGEAVGGRDAHLRTHRA